MPTTPSNAEQGLGEVALEMAVEDVAGAARRIIVEDALFGQRQPDQVARQLQHLGQPADPAPTSGGARSSHFWISGTTVSSSAT